MQEVQETQAPSLSGRPPGGGNGNALQHSCLENPMDRGAWWAIIHGVVKELDMTERLLLPGEGNSNPIQYSRLENPMDRGAWWATVHAVTKSQTQLSDEAHSTA